MAKKKSRFAFQFKEMEQLSEKIEAAGGDLQKAADSALKATHAYITHELGRTIAGHVFTGDTKNSLVQSPNVNWITPNLASVGIGFDLSEGWASIFLMWGTPKQAPDLELRAAAYSPKLKREVAKIQREVLEKVLQRLQR